MSDLHRSIISAGDVYNFHFIKKEKVMSIQDAAGNSFSVPLNTAIQFGLVYDPANDLKQAVKGYSFKSIGDLVDYPVPPKVIRATRRYDTGDAKSSVESNEILIVKNIARTMISKKYSVKVHSTLTSKLYKGD